MCNTACALSALNGCLISSLPIFAGVFGHLRLSLEFVGGFVRPYLDAALAAFQPLASVSCSLLSVPVSLLGFTPRRRLSDAVFSFVRGLLISDYASLTCKEMWMGPGAAARLMWRVGLLRSRYDPGAAARQILSVFLSCSRISCLIRMVHFSGTWSSMFSMPSISHGVPRCSGPGGDRVLSAGECSSRFCAFNYD